MSALDKCFRCGMFDIDGVAVCRLHGHEIKKPLLETCEHIIQLDSAIDSLNADIVNIHKEQKGFIDTNKFLSGANIKLKECVEFYASKKNWTFEYDMHRQVSIVGDGYGAIATFQLIKGGLKARKCIEEISSLDNTTKDNQ